MSETIFIAKESTSQLILVDTADIKTELDLIETSIDTVKTAVAANATYANNFSTQTSDSGVTFLTLTGKYELTGLFMGVSQALIIRIDGAADRIILPATTANTYANLSNLGIKCNTSMLITAGSSSPTTKFTYRLLV